MAKPNSLDLLGEASWKWLLLDAREEGKTLKRQTLGISFVILKLIRIHDHIKSTPENVICD